MRLIFNSPRRVGTEILWSYSQQKWRLVPSYRPVSGIGTSFKWDEVLPDQFATKKAAAAHRKQLRSEGKLP